MASDKRFAILNWFFFIAAIQFLAALLVLGSIHSEEGAGLLFGLSLNRLLLLSMVLIPLLGIGTLYFAIRWRPTHWETLSWFLDVVFEKIHSIVFGIFIVISVSILLIPEKKLGGLYSVVERLQPVLFLTIALAAELALLQFFWLKKTPNLLSLQRSSGWLITSSAVFVIIAGIMFFMALTGTGLTPKTFGWHRPGTPLVFGQMFTVWVLGLFFLFFEKTVRSRIRARILNVALCGVIYLVAVFAWLGEPMKRESYFTPEPTPPNFEYYPYSDSATYDRTAQLIMIGEGDHNQVVLRPLYVFFLASAHSLVGQEYESVIFLQVVVLAFLPVFVYLFVSVFGNRMAGVLTALLVILREKNSIELTSIIEVSHSKLLLSDVFTTMMMVIFLYFFAVWLQRRAPSHWTGVAAGAFLGLTALIRSQTQLLIPVLLVGMFFLGGVNWKKFLSRALVFLIGFVVVTLPWMWRNYHLNGRPVLENTEFYMEMIAGGYSEPGDVAEQLPGETLDEYLARVKRQMTAYVVNHPVDVAQDLTSYFLHNETLSVIYFPLSLKLYDPILYTKSFPFWSEPQLHLTVENGIMLVFSLGLLALGIGWAVHRWGFLGWMPLLIHLTYSFSVVVARISGWRFIMPVDWIPLMYYVLGLAGVTYLCLSLVTKRFEIESLFTVSNFELRPSSALFGKTAYAIGVFAVVGLSLPLTEKLIPQRYEELGHAALIQRYAADGLALDDGVIPASELKKFIETEADSFVLHGRALYPLYYESGEYWGDDNSYPLVLRNISRLQFQVIGPVSMPVYLPVESAPSYFPNSSDVFVIGCRNEAGIRALLVVLSERSEVLRASPWNGLTCSTPMIFGV